jgi:hypothetical protein
MESKVTTLKDLFAVGGCPIWMCGANDNETLVRDQR